MFGAPALPVFDSMMFTLLLYFTGHILNVIFFIHKIVYH